MSKAKSSKKSHRKINSVSTKQSKTSSQQPSTLQWQKHGFVGCQNRISMEDLERILVQFQPTREVFQQDSDQKQIAQPIYFLKWLHQVSGMVNNLEHLPAKFPSPEGQMFTDSISLRWRQQGQQYDLLLLSPNPLSCTAEWQEISENNQPISWETRLLPILFHDEQDPQYPNRFNFQGVLEKDICQRYFRDACTGTVHFVALTLKPS